MRTRPLHHLVVPALLALLSQPLAGQARADESLLRRVDSLERRVLELERRLQLLEAPARSDQGRVRASSGNPRDLANWRRLREGMSYDAVRDILGEPSKVNGGSIAFWEYPRGGQVTFMSGRVYSWQEPEL